MKLLIIILIPLLLFPQKPQIKKRPNWVHLIPDVGMTVDGKPHVSWSISKYMSYLRAVDRDNYEQALEAWRDSVQLRVSYFDSIKIQLTLEKAINDSIYYDKLLQITLLRFKRGDINEEQLLKTSKDYYDSIHNLKGLRLDLIINKEVNNE